MISNLHPLARAVVELFPQGECKTVVVFVLCVRAVVDDDGEAGRLLKIRIVRFATVKKRMMI